MSSLNGAKGVGFLSAEIWTSAYEFVNIYFTQGNQDVLR